MQFKEEVPRAFQAEPGFSFCWAPAWRLLLLSTAISFVPLIFFNLLGALGLALKVLRSKSFNGSSVRFYKVQPPNQFSPPPRSSTST